MYRAGPVPPETGRTGSVPTGFANPGRGAGVAAGAEVRGGLPEEFM
jgi:hypothetical protein